MKSWLETFEEFTINHDKMKAGDLKVGIIQSAIRGRGMATCGIGSGSQLPNFKSHPESELD
jgi:hypothetical protein